MYVNELVPIVVGVFGASYRDSYARNLVPRASGLSTFGRDWLQDEAPVSEVTRGLWLCKNAGTVTSIVV